MIDRRYKVGEDLYWVHRTDIAIQIMLSKVKSIPSYKDDPFYDMENGITAQEGELYSCIDDVRSVVDDYLINTNIMRFSR